MRPDSQTTFLAHERLSNSTPPDELKKGSVINWPRAWWDSSLLGVDYFEALTATGAMDGVSHLDANALESSARFPRNVSRVNGLDFFDRRHVRAAQAVPQVGLAWHVRHWATRLNVLGITRMTFPVANPGGG
jgi:hypothetical protein